MNDHDVINFFLCRLFQIRAYQVSRSQIHEVFQSYKNAFLTMLTNLDLLTSSGAHINVVGASSPTTREIGDDLMLSDNLVIVADCMRAIRLESGWS